MACKPKTLGLALIAVFAMSAVMETAARAGEFEAEGKKVTVTGEQIPGFVTGIENSGKLELGTTAGVFKCGPVAFDGILNGASTELKLTTIYGITESGLGCTLDGVSGPSVHMRSCAYLFTAGNTIGATSNITVATHITCTTPGDVIEVTRNMVSNCVLTIPEQKLGESTITAENSGGAGAAMDIKAIVDVPNIRHEYHGTCPNSPATTTLVTDATYRGVVTLKAVEFAPPGNKIGLTVK